jgi:hypothetical protein
MLRETMAKLGQLPVTHCRMTKLPKVSVNDLVISRGNKSLALAGIQCSPSMSAVFGPSLALLSKKPDNRHSGKFDTF